MANTVLITGATGKQGGAVISALLLSNTSDLIIYALTRDTESGGAKALAAKSSQIKLIKGDFNDCDAIFKSIDAPIKAVFCVTMPSMGFGAKADAEEVQGKSLVDAALKHGVEHFVFTSVDRHGSDSDNDTTNVPHFITKAHIETHLREKSAGKMTWTILRPTAFMDNFTTGFAGKIFPTAWKMVLSAKTKLQLISTKDIGWFGAQALLKPKEFAGRAISLAGDELTYGEANSIFREKFGTDIPTTFGFVGSGLVWAIGDLGKMFKYFEVRTYTGAA